MRYVIQGRGHREREVVKRRLWKVPMRYVIEGRGAQGEGSSKRRLCHLGWRSWSPDTILKVYYPRTIHAMFALNWLTGFRGEDF
jgi:hypothetical protein